ncbi:MAG: hypothetical protein GF331_21950 [Chitinivibrionales bacterium]|nr:hypothetical protein [Chitinivibrionales bacterium]
MGPVTATLESDTLIVYSIQAWFDQVELVAATDGQDLSIVFDYLGAR